MKVNGILGLTALMTATACAGADLNNAGEGNADQRKKLDALQGAPAPALQVTDWVNSQPLRLADLKGKIVVLDFWATWCGPCIASIPHNNELFEKYKDKGVMFIGVCHPRRVERMAAVVKDKGLKYPTAKDPEGATIKAYRVNSFPDYYIIDRKGVLRVADCKNKMVEDVIETLLQER